jgi:hypothetical protein
MHRWNRLFVAALLAADVRLPWQLLPAECRSAALSGSFSHVLLHLGSPICVPIPCGRSSGRPTGMRSPPAQRFPAVTLTH